MNVGKKKIAVILAALLVLGSIAGGLFWRADLWSSQRLQPVTIAVVGPRSGPDKISGNAMYQGIQLYVQTHDLTKMLRGRPLALRLFNDQNSNRQAAKTANDVADSAALVVLGHYFSNSALVAGDIYQKRGLPAITASATADAITQKNEWYFRTIPNNQFQGQFLAAYVHHILKQTATAIVFDTDLYGASLKQSYEAKARELGLEIQGMWPIDRERGNLAQTVKTIVTALQNLPNPGGIFLALHEAEAVTLVAELGAYYTLIGPDALATPQFLAELRQFPEEQSQPGALSDGLYAVTPFLADLAAPPAAAFLREFRKRYGGEPGWETACYYDAMAMALEAITRAEPDGRNLTADRRKVRDALAEMAQPERALAGVTGNLSFDAARNIPRPLAVGIYEQQRLSPAYIQYQALAGNAPAAPAETLELGQVKMTPANIVKTGLNLQAIPYLNLNANEYALNGYLRFRFQGNLPITELTFQHALTPIALGAPVFEATRNHVTEQVYHLNAHFKPYLLTTFYPFEWLFLSVQFRHVLQPAASLRFVPDGELLATHAAADASRQQLVPGWTLEQVDQTATMLTEGGTTYSRFNIIVQMQRLTVGWVVKNLLPLGVLLTLLYAVYWLPVERFAPRLALLLCVALAAGMAEVFWRWQLAPGLLLIEYVIFVVYALTGLAFVVSLGSYFAQARQAQTWVTILTLAGRILHLLIVALLAAALVFFIARRLPREIADSLAQML